MIKLKNRMNEKEWREFCNSLLAGIFGGFVVLAWSCAYEIVKGKGFLSIILIPPIFAFLFFITLIFLLRYLFKK